ncbi:hypothetical protein LPJ59_000557 [Coemansia sp. RSA 2399]|nr:hypothetical protein LPJ59_000557 [Coemansia sp. RSA 2399]KAJ1908231.1 hypothetical protein LPJ81_000245 [Coemansia sp. IMI 209127]
MNRLRSVAPRLAIRPCVGGGRRSLWSAASSANTSLVSAALECAERIKDAVAHRNTQPSCLTARDSCFVLVSQSYQSADIDKVVGALRQQLDSVSNNIFFSGTVVDHVILGGVKRPSIGNGLSVIYNCSSDFNGPQLEAHPFYIGDIHGRQRLREVAVGRWHNKVTDRFKEQHSNPAQWISGHSSVTQASSHMVLPPELVRDIEAPSLVDFILFAADKESRQALDLLDKRFPRAAKLGIVGSQTPFVNGREYTLFADSHVYESGMVGFAFARSGQQSKAAVGEPRVSHDGLVPISDALRIVRCKGNVILELENGDAAHSLIASMRRKRTEMPNSAGEDNRLFAKITPEDNPSASKPPQPVVVFQVTGGNPAKGGLAIDTLRDLSNGQRVQFMMMAATPASSGSSNTSDISLRFGAADFCGGPSLSPAICAKDTPAAMLFGGVTEGGFVYSRRLASSEQNSGSSVLSGCVECSVPGSTATLALK